MPDALIGDAHIFYRGLDGSPPSVVCIHGYCQSSLFWEPTLRAVAAAGTGAIAPDLPGFGESAGCPGPYTMEAYADRLAALLDRLALDRVVLVGGSMGGVVALQFALRHPDRLERLLLVATGAASPNPAAGLKKADELLDSPWDTAAASAAVAGFFFREMPDHDLARFRDVALAASPTARVEAMRSNSRTNVLDRLGEITAPTLIVQGREDRGRTPEHGEEMRRRIPNARLIVLEGAGHTPQLEQTAAFHAAVLPFLLRGE